MNAMLSATLPLPACLDRPIGSANHRRHRVATVDLSVAAVDRFNQLLEQVGRTGEPLDRDRLATAARELHERPPASVPPACIRQRLFRVKAAVCMVEDRQWRAPEDAAGTIRLIADYVAANDHLFPDTAPVIGRFDDAILMDAAWPRLGREIEAYLDFRRLRRAVTDRGGARARFDRDAWFQACVEEAALLAQFRRVREASYVSMDPPRFRIH